MYNIDVQPTASVALSLTSSSIDKYPAKAHAHRVADTLKLHQGAIALSGKPSELWQDSDMPVPFRQDRYFYYLTGCNEPDCHVVYNIGKDTLTLYIPPINLRKAVWGGQGSTVDEALEKYDVDEVKYIKPSKDHLQTRPEVSGFQLKAAIDTCRVVKDEYEIELVRKANKVSAAAHTAVLQALPRMKNEAEVHGLFVGTCLALQAKEQAYHPIVGSGPNAATLHYGSNDQEFGGRQTLLIDAGAEWDCYASDVTRTLPLNRQNPGYWQSVEAEEIYGVVQTMQEECISMLKPGVPFIDVHRKAQLLAVRGLKSLGILRGDEAAILKAGTILAFFPHGLGHHIGLECHDVSGPSTSANCAEIESAAALVPLAFSVASRSLCSLEAPGLVAGNIVTVEPGIYFNKELLRIYLKTEVHSAFIDGPVLNRYIGIGGVRIEDCILITRHGYENLTTAPKGDAALDIIRESVSS